MDRGLSAQLVIRKVQVDLEVQANRRPSRPECESSRCCRRAAGNHQGGDVQRVGVSPAMHPVWDPSHVWRSLGTLPAFDQLKGPHLRSCFRMPSICGWPGLQRDGTHGV